jgi:N6-L-threonylcarbamoyladenine synthase
MKDHGKYQKIGQTQDDAAGEAFDKAAKLLGLGYPGGPAVAVEAAKFPNFKLQIPNSKFQIILPRPMINSNDFDFSFSGLKTALLYKIKRDKNWQKKIPEYCCEFQQAVIDVLIKKTIQAARQYKVKNILLAGGVAANRELGEQLAENIKKELPFSIFHFPTSILCTDNAAMIACAGYFHAIKKGFTLWWKLRVNSNLEL